MTQDGHGLDKQKSSKTRARAATDKLHPEPKESAHAKQPPNR